MKQLTKAEFFKGINFQQNISYPMLKRLINGNAQYVIDICIELNM